MSSSPRSGPYASSAPSFVGLSATELRAARLDGDVFELGRGFLPADAPETPALRAATLVGLYGTTRVAVGLSAAWVHGAVEEEPEPHLAQTFAGRERKARPTGLRIRDRAIHPDDVVRLGGLLVATRAVTLADLASGWSSGSLRAQGTERVHARSTHAGLEDALVTLARDEDTLSDAVAWLEAHPRRPGRRVGLTALRRLRRHGAASEPPPAT